MENYRECMECCRLKGESMPYSYEEYNREQVLKRLKELLWVAQSGQEVEHECEEFVWQEVLWILQAGEKIEKGFYSCNKSDTKVVVVASPALMALLMGEYDLSVELCKVGMYGGKNDIASELKQEGKESFLGGGQIRFCEACLLSFDMSVQQLEFFKQKGFFESANLWYEKETAFSEVRFIKDKWIVWDSMSKVLQRIRENGEVYGEGENILILILWYALCNGLDRDNVTFWKDLFKLFEATDYLTAISLTLHEYARVYYDMSTKVHDAQDRLIKGMKEFFYHAEVIQIQYIENYISTVILDDGIWKMRYSKLGRDYFSVIKKIEGEVTGNWLRDMMKLLKTRDFPLIELAFKSGYLREDCLEHYIQYLSGQKDCAGLIPYLIHKKWSGKENMNGSI